MNFIGSEFYRNLLFKNNKHVCGIIIKNPFDKNIANISYKLIQLTDNNLKIETTILDNEWHLIQLGNYRIEVTKYDYEGNVIDDNMKIGFSINDDYRTISFTDNKNKDDRYSYSVSFTSNENDEDDFFEAMAINIKNTHIDNPIYSPDLNIGTDDELTISKYLTSNEDLAKYDLKQDNMVMTILFANGYVVPIVRVYSNCDEKSIEDAINCIHEMYLDSDKGKDYNNINEKCIIDLTYNSKVEKKETHIKHKDVLIYQQGKNEIHYNI